MQMMEQFTSAAEGEFQKLLKDSSHGLLRRQAFSAFGLSNSPECKGGLENLSQACLNLMSKELTREAKLTFSQGPMDMSLYSMSALAVHSGSKAQSRLRDRMLLQDSPYFQRVVASFEQKLRDSAAQSELAQKIEKKIFPKVRDLLIKKIEALVPDPKMRSLMRDKLLAIEYEGVSCSIGEGNQPPLIFQLLEPNARYQPHNNKFSICRGFLLRTSSEFALVHTIAHELAHSIDPCVLTLSPLPPLEQGSSEKPLGSDQWYPIPGLLSCLRGEQSVHAKRVYRNLGAPSEGYFVSQPQAQYPASGSSAPPPLKDTACQDQVTANNQIYHQHDQIGEAYSDWLATEILPEYIGKNFPKLSQERLRMGYSNVWRMTCSPEESFRAKNSGLRRRVVSLDIHPDTSLRANRILLVQPQIRKQMGCPETMKTAIYCSEEVRLKSLADSVTSEPANNKLPIINLPPAKPNSPKGVQ